MRMSMTNIFMVNADVLFNTKKLFQMFLFSFSSFFQGEIAIWVIDSISKVNLERIACQWLLIENIHS